MGDTADIEKCAGCGKPIEPGQTRTTLLGEDGVFHDGCGNYGGLYPEDMIGW